MARFRGLLCRVGGFVSGIVSFFFLVSYFDRFYGSDIGQSTWYRIRFEL